jgi:hypothetical protein
MPVYGFGADDESVIRLFDFCARTVEELSSQGVIFG